MTLTVVGATVAVGGIILIVARSTVSRLNERSNRKMAADDRTDKSLAYDTKNAACAGAVLIIAGFAMVIAGFVTS